MFFKESNNHSNTFNAASFFNSNRSFFNQEVNKENDLNSIQLHAKTEIIPGHKGEEEEFNVISEPIEGSKTKTNVINSNNNKNNHRKISELLSTFLINEKKYFTILKMVIKEFFSYHIIADCLTLLMVLFQIYFDQNCFMHPLCKCYDNFWIKLFNLLKDIFSFWIYISYMMHHCLFFYREMRRKYLIQILFYIINFSNVGYTYFSQDGDKTYINTFFIYIIAYSGFFLLSLAYLYFLKFQFKTWFQKTLDGQLICYILYIIYLCSKFCLPIIKECINSIILDEKLAKNIFQCILLIYNKLLIVLLYFCLWKFYKMLSNEATNREETTLRLTFAARMSLCYIISINVCSILRMRSDDWASWITLVNYLAFLLNCYTRFDLYFWLFEKVYFLLMKKKIARKAKSEEKLYFEKVLSGCFLDLQCVFSFRLIILFLWEKWLNSPYAIEYYSDCELTKSNAFPISQFSLITIILSNWIMIFIILIYIKKNKNMVLYYKINKNRFLNLYVIILLHYYSEIILQMNTYSFFDIH